MVDDGSGRLGPPWPKLFGEAMWVPDNDGFPVVCNWIRYVATGMIYWVCPRLRAGWHNFGSSSKHGYDLDEFGLTWILIIWADDLNKWIYRVSWHRWVGTKSMCSRRS